MNLTFQVEKGRTIKRFGETDNNFIGGKYYDTYLNSYRQFNPSCQLNLTGSAVI